MTLFDPTISSGTKAFQYATRPASLENLRVGLVENTKHNSEALLKLLASRMEARFQTRVGHLDHKQSSGHSVTEEAVALLKTQVDVVLAGIGD